MSLIADNWDFTVHFRKRRCYIKKSFSNFYSIIMLAVNLSYIRSFTICFNYMSKLFMKFHNKCFNYMSKLYTKFHIVFENILMTTLLYLKDHDFFYYVKWQFILINLQFLLISCSIFNLYSFCHLCIIFLYKNNNTERVYIIKISLCNIIKFYIVLNFPP